MKHQAPFVVKRLAPMIGRPESARRITVTYYASTLEAAIEAAHGFTRRRLALEGIRAREGGAGPAWLASKLLELERTATWIERRDQSASIARRRGGRGEGGA
jgi:hypothetical protein